MSLSQSKLMLQLSKQQRVTEKMPFSEEKLQEIYTTISKIEPKNLMLVEFLTLIIEKNLIKNSFKVQTFYEMFEQIKGKKLDQEPSAFNKVNTGQKQEQKFNKKKFLKLLKDVAKLLYPGDPKAYQTTLYTKLIMPDSEQNRLKLDQNVKKFLTEEVINSINNYQKQFQVLFQAFMPENYNSKLQFSWNQLRLLQKRLPIICLLRILFQADVSPQNISQTQFLQMVSKMIPASNSNHKQAMFYYGETFNNYMREHIFSDEIKLLEGDIGLSFFEFQIMFVRLATEYCKENKTEFSKYIDKFMSVLGLGQIVKHKKEQPKMSKLQITILNYLKENGVNKAGAKTSIKKEGLLKKQRKQLNQILQDPDSNPKGANQNIKKLEHQSLLVTREQLIRIKKNLDDQLPPISQKPVVDKQNQGYYNINEKFVVIGDQPPKIQQKNKPAAKNAGKQKQEDSMLGYKQEQQNNDAEKPSLILNRKKKLRLNTQFPIILSEVFYPNTFNEPNLLKLKQYQEIYLETTYIHLGERMYEQAYSNFQKARNIYLNEKNQKNDRKNNASQFYFSILQAQIFESAGKDQAALMYYYNSKESGHNLPSSEASSKAFSYLGLSSSLYHLEEYQYSLRCLLKAKQIYGESLETQSLQNALLLNNMASCFMVLNRNQQAAKFYNISHQILDLKVGRFDQRTLVVQRNIAKNKKAYIEQMPSFKTMWRTYVQKNSNLSSAKAAKAKTGKK